MYVWCWLSSLQGRLLIRKEADAMAMGYKVRVCQRSDVVLYGHDTSLDRV